MCLDPFFIPRARSRQALRRAQSAPDGGGCSTAELLRKPTLRSSSQHRAYTFIGNSLPRVTICMAKRSFDKCSLYMTNRLSIWRRFSLRLRQLLSAIANTARLAAHTLLIKLATWIEAHRAERASHTVPADKGTLQIYLLEYSALLGASVVATIQLLQVPQLGLSLLISVHSFAIAIPVLALRIYEIPESLSADAPYDFSYPWHNGMMWIGWGSSLLGLTCLFWHFSWVAGTLVVACGVFAAVNAILNAWAAEEIQETSKDTQEDNQQEAEKQS
jgi:hypothetical protein